LVVRFWNQDGTEWVGNFQGAQDSSTTILDWPEATSVVVLARYNLYLVDVGSPDTYVTLDASHHVDYIMLDETHAFLFAAESTAICAFNRKRQLVWSQKHLNGFDAQLVSCANGVLTIEVVEELGEPVRTVALSTTDGSII
jgi:hypothetical protein